MARFCNPAGDPALAGFACPFFATELDQKCQGVRTQPRKVSTVFRRDAGDAEQRGIEKVCLGLELFALADGSEGCCAAEPFGTGTGLSIRRRCSSG